MRGRIAELSSQAGVLQAEVERAKKEKSEAESVMQQYDRHVTSDYAAIPFKRYKEFAAGVNLRTVSARLRHSSPVTTSKIYAHAIQSADEAAAETIQNILSPLGNN